jgi:anti-sigma-K factor RskA
VTNDGARFVDSGAYVLDALTEGEREQFETQLVDSEDLRSEVTELTDTAVLLGLAVDPVTPSPQLRESILGKIASVPQLSGEVAQVREIRSVPEVPEVPEVPAVPAVPARFGAASEKARSRWFARPVAVITAAAAAVVLVVGGVGIVTSLGQNSTQSQAGDALASIEGAPDSQRAAASISTGGKATLVWSAKLKKSALIVNGLAKLPSDKTYELWYIDSGGTPTKAGLLEVTGSRTWRVLTGALSAGDTVGVTVEPAGGSKAPTTKPIVAIPAL